MESDLDNKKNNFSAKSILTNFSDSTTAHGCAQINKSKSSTGKLIWLLIFVLCVIGATVCISQLVARYFSFPTKDVIEIVNEPISFPSLSFCSLVSVASSFEEKANKGVFPNPDDPVAKVVRTLRGKDKTFNNASFPIYGQLQVPTVYYRMISYRWMYENAPGDDGVLKFGHKQNDLFSQCISKGTTCDATAETRMFKNEVFYQCYTYNFKDANSTEDKPIVHTTGVLDGFSTQIFLDISDESMSFYNPYCPLSGSSGLRLMIHEPGTRPDPIHSGLDIAPGFTTNVGLRKKIRKKMPPPYGDCQDRDMLDGLPYKYDKAICEQQCQQRYIIHRCNCTSALFPVSDHVKNTSFCGKMDLDNFNADSPDFNKIKQEMAGFNCEEEAIMVERKEYPAELKCDCPNKCSRDWFDIEISQSYWPTESVQEQFFNHHVAIKGAAYHNSSMYKLLDSRLRSNDTEKNMANRGLIRKNFLRLNVHFNSLMTEVTTQVEEYPFSDMISGVGGGFGVYIGFSIVTICEIAVLLVHLVTAIIKGNGKKVTDGIPPDAHQITLVQEMTKVAL